MAFIPAVNCAAVTPDGVFLGVDCVNTVYFQRNTPWTSAQLLALATGIYNWWDVWMQPLTSLSGTLQRVRVRDLTTADAPVVEYTGAGPISGTVVGTPTPSNVSFAIKFTTGLAGRSRRGRNFMWGLTDGMRSGNIISLAQADAYVSAYQALFNVATANSCTWVVLSRFTNKLPRPTGVMTPITNVSYTDLNLDTMRNRAPGHGD